MTEKVKRYLIVEVDVIGNTNLCESCPLVNRKEMCCQYRINKDMKKGCPLKPMPQKKEVEVNEIEDIMRTEYSIEDIYTNKYVATIRLATDKLISIGWNACLEEIEKC